MERRITLRSIYKIRCFGKLIAFIWMLSYRVCCEVLWPPASDKTNVLKHSKIFPVDLHELRIKNRNAPTTSDIRYRWFLNFDIPPNFLLSIFIGDTFNNFYLYWTLKEKPKSMPLGVDFERQSENSSLRYSLSLLDLDRVLITSVSSPSTALLRVFFSSVLALTSHDLKMVCRVK